MKTSPISTLFTPAIEPSSPFDVERSMFDVGRSTRRSFITTASLALAAPYIRAESKTAPEFHGSIVGHGGFRYRVDKLWSKADPAKQPVKDCHEMVQAGDGRLFMLTNHKQNNMLIYAKDGTLQGWWTLGFGGAHGLTLNREAGGQEFLYLTDTAGRVADGYGSQYVLHFDKDGKYVTKFGGRSTQPLNPGKFMQAHGIALDTRGPEPLLLCTERIRNEFNWFTLDGKHVRGVYLPGAYVSRPVLHGKNLYSGVCFGAKPDDYRMWQGRGFVTILDENDKVVSNPGGQAPEYQDSRLKVMLQDKPVFNNCHDVCVDTAGDLYVCQWNSGNVYPYKLERV
jgi:hypothetical protein